MAWLRPFTDFKEYPTLWSSNIASGDFLLLRQGYAIPQRETEWSAGPRVFHQLFTASVMPIPKDRHAGFRKLYEDNRQVSDYFMQKYARELLGFAVRSGGKGKPVLVDVVPNRSY